MIIDYSVKSPNLDNIYYGLNFITTWNTRDIIAVVVLLGKALVTDSSVGIVTLIDKSVGGVIVSNTVISSATVVDKTDE